MAAAPTVPTNTAEASSSWIDDDLHVCSHVWVCRDGHVKPLESLYDGPYLVLSHSAKVFQLQMGPKSVSVSIDRLKPVHADGEVTPMQPKRRGRPPKCSTSTATGKKRRGRPPKTQTIPEVTVLGGAVPTHAMYTLATQETNTFLGPTVFSQITSCPGSLKYVYALYSVLFVSNCMFVKYS